MLKTLIEKLRRPTPQRVVTDWTIGWSLRDLADLPPHHPRQNER
ncbi:MAG TPA: hypothetical protein VIN06_08710 [Devosia sp.]